MHDKGGMCVAGGMHGRRACVVGGLPGRGCACRRHNY